MPRNTIKLIITIFFVIIFAFAAIGSADDFGRKKNHGKKGKDKTVQLGPRPYYLVEDMDESKLKTKLQKCTKDRFKRTDFSIGHRGAALQFPEHTMESYMAAARMGAGIIECDVTFTADSELVCRHSQCDLHTTTDIVAREDLRDRCTVPPDISADGELLNAADIKCCTSDFTLDEFKSLCGKMDAANSSATTVDEYLGGTANWRTDLYSTCGTVISHAESIELFKSLGVKMTPELKEVSGVTLPFGEFETQADYAQKMIDEYKAARISPRKVWAQSFNFDDVLYWIENEPRFGKQAVFLDARYSQGLDPNDPDTWMPTMTELVDQGLNIIAPPMWVLLTVEDGKIVPSMYARGAKAAGLDIITWTLERSGLLKDGGGFYYQSIVDVINNDGDAYVALDVLAQEVGILGIFSDWPATVTYYANCLKPKGH